MPESLSLDDLNRLLDESLQAESRLLRLLCAASKRADGGLADVRFLLPRLCGYHDRTRALMGKMLERLGTVDTYLLRHPLKGRVSCGPAYPADLDRVRAEVLVHAR